MIKLPDSVCSPNDLTALILETREYAKWYEHELIKKRAGSAARSVPPILSPTTGLFLRGLNQSGSLMRVKLEQTLGELEAYKKSAPSITLTLAAPATESVKKVLTIWCRKEISPDILVSFEFNRTLLGGMVVRYGSHVHDWSFRRQLLNNKVRFSEVLASV